MVIGTPNFFFFLLSSHSFLFLLYPKDFNVSEILTKLRRKSSKAEAELSKLKQQMSIENYEQKVPIQIREKHTERVRSYFINNVFLVIM